MAQVAEHAARHRRHRRRWRDLRSRRLGESRAVYPAMQGAARAPGSTGHSRGECLGRAATRQASRCSRSTAAAASAAKARHGGREGRHCSSTRRSAGHAA